MNIHNYSYKDRLELEEGCACHGFKITRITPLPRLRATAIQARHEASGAQFLQIAAEDEENLFAIAFRTPPPDDTGVPHILEHAVLNGSRKYPVKDPFVEMLKNSMATFLNAMTYSDKTVYPVASNVKTDFFNLVDVYCDAVFHPRITPFTLKQEGSYLGFADPADPNSPLRLNGIVYNEMKGAYSDVESYTNRMIEKYLFPGSPYGNDSGGDPDTIPDLTYEQFRKYYDSFYHPANARIFIYGDIPAADHFKFLDERLRDCPPLPDNPISSEIPRQPRWTEPRKVQIAYPADSDSEPEKNSIITVNWLVGDCTEPLIDLAMELLVQLLLGDASSPLHKALIDSRLGKDLTLSGYQNGVLETTFHVGLKGTAASRVEEVENLIFSTLEKVSREGFDQERMAIAFHQMQYGQREISSRFPLKLMSWAYNSWNYDLDPLVYFRTEELLEELKQKIEGDSSYLTLLIKDRLLNNKHSLTLSAVPDSGLQNRKETERQNCLAAKRARMSQDELNEIKEEAIKLRREQQTPNPPEAIAALPQLPVSAIPEKPREIPREVSELSENLNFIHNHLFTNQVNYLTIGIDIQYLPKDLWTYLPLFCLLFSQMGTERENYETMARRIAGSTSRFQAGTFLTSMSRDPQIMSTQFTVNITALDETLPRAMDIFKELLFTIDFSDQRRLRDVIEQTRERFLSSIIPNGHRLAALHAGRTLFPITALGNELNGVPQIRLVNQLALEFEERAEELIEKLNQIKQFLQQRRRLTVSFTGSSSLAEHSTAWFKNLKNKMKPDIFKKEVRNIVIPSVDIDIEGLAFPADVAYYAACLPAPHLSQPGSVAMKLLAHILNFDYMWENIRVLGGAYGASCSYDPGSSIIKLISHQDPDIVNTVKVCDSIGDYLKNFRLSSEALDRARIACAKNNEQPIRPGPATSTSFALWLSELTPEIRQSRRKELLSVTPEEVVKAGQDIFQANMNRARRCSISSRSRLEDAKEKLQRPMNIEKLFI